METKREAEIFYIDEQTTHGDAPAGPLCLASLTSGEELAGRVVRCYRELLKKAGGSAEVLCLENIDRRFSDGEVVVRLEHHVNGLDVFLFQSLFSPEDPLAIDRHYLAFLAAVRTFREHGAGRITGVLPYLAYARQDKPTAFKREPVTARLLADMTITAGLDRLVTWAPHCGQLRGFYGRIPVDFLDPLAFFTEEFAEYAGRDDAIAVAPDIGASKFAARFGRALRLNTAIAAKHRPEAEKVIITEIIGDFRNKKTAIILDDMISNGGTVYALAKKLVEEKGISEILIGVSHNLCVGNAPRLLDEMHKKYHLKKLVVSDSIPQGKESASLPFLKIKCLADSLARTINRIHHGKSVSAVFTDPRRREQC